MHSFHSIDDAHAVHHDAAAAIGLPEAALATTPGTVHGATRARHDGWAADRQRLFLAALADTGSVADAAQAAGITARSAYRLRSHPKGAAFAKAWQGALMTAAGRLTAVAFERATTGSPRQLWRDGQLVTTRTAPSDQMLMFLLRHLQPRLFGVEADIRDGERMRAGYADAMTALADAPVDCDLLDLDDVVPGHPDGGRSHHPL